MRRGGVPAGSGVLAAVPSSIPNGLQALRPGALHTISSRNLPHLPCAPLPNTAVISVLLRMMQNPMGWRTRSQECSHLLSSSCPASAWLQWECCASLLPAQGRNRSLAPPMAHFPCPAASTHPSWWHSRAGDTWPELCSPAELQPWRNPSETQSLQEGKFIYLFN